MMNVLWACFKKIVLIISFFPRLNPLSDTKILLLYPALPDLMLRLYHWETCKYLVLCYNRPCSKHN